MRQKNVFVCPNCGLDSDCVDAKWDETQYVECTGTYHPDRGCETEDTECHDTNEHNHVYNCPECNDEFESDVEDHFYVQGTEEYLKRKEALVEEGILDDASCIRPVVAGGLNE
jgi:predicted RNA-binding Zn-ribbon protein involved in translation (DUF1610 family)